MVFAISNLPVTEAMQQLHIVYPSYKSFFNDISRPTALYFWENYPSRKYLKGKTVEDLRKELILVSHNKCSTKTCETILDAADDDKVKIIFEQPHMVSCNFFFTYEGDGSFLSVVEGKEAFKINKMYGVTQGNIIFKITNINVEADMIIIAKNIEVQIIQ